ncbi:hypothetical protein [Roseovarius sp.]|uniref:hypothetical protein n=1 Tax=Roseovarius sp. TaxID=1486281 RepID=UPI00262ADA45|nr:hypothetical protein [Roseovarius sp.]MDM8168225.1 hypothetical protein [Roseovarius sp.]
MELMSGSGRDRDPKNGYAELYSEPCADVPTVRTLWVTRKFEDALAEAKAGDVEQTDVLQLSNGAILLQGSRELSVRHRSEFFDLSDPSEMHVLASVHFARRFVSPPSIMLAFGPSRPGVTICAERVTSESFTIAMQSACADPIDVSVSWKAVGFSTFGNFSMV